MSDAVRNQQEMTIEINTLFGFIDELNYYEMLCLTPDCTIEDIEWGYQDMARRFHPEVLVDANEETVEQSKYLMLSFHEAKETLSSISTRLQYDAQLNQGQIRIENTQLAQVQDQGANDPANAAMTENGKKYWMLALEAFENKNYSGAAMNVGFALQYESNNETFLAFKAKAEEEAKKAPKQNNNPYKIRL